MRSVELLYDKAISTEMVVRAGYDKRSELAAWEFPRRSHRKRRALGSCLRPACFFFAEVNSRRQRNKKNQISMKKSTFREHTAIYYPTWAFQFLRASFKIRMNRRPVAQPK
jgi:hypothetical protein